MKIKVGPVFVLHKKASVFVFLTYAFLSACAACVYLRSIDFRGGLRIAQACPADGKFPAHSVTVK